MKTISKELLAACDIAAQDDVRPILSGVKISADKIAATDSYCLVEFNRSATDDIENYPELAGVEPVKEISEKTKEGEDLDYLVLPAKDIKKYVKFPKHKFSLLNNAILANNRENQVSLVTTDLEVTQENTFRKKAGKYPDYEQVIPQTEANTRVCVNLELLKRVCSAFLKAGCKEAFIETRGNKDPLILRGDYHKQEGSKIGMIMPLKKDFVDGTQDRQTEEIK